MKYSEVYPSCHSNLKDLDLGCGQHPSPTACPQLPGTLLRIFIPAGAVVNLLNLIEVASPSGVCLIVRVPILGGFSSNNGRTADLAGLLESVKAAGGTVEFVNQ